MPQASRDPFRSAPLVVLQTQTERAFCPWCRSREGGLFGALLSDDLRDCNAILNRKPSGERERCKNVNTSGHCELYVPSRLTRLLRVVGKRAPVMIDREGES